MSTKGNVKVLDQAALDEATFSAKYGSRKLNELINTAQEQIKKTQEMDFGSMEGGKGTVIIETLNKTVKSLSEIKENVAKIATVLDDKLSKAAQAMKTTGAVADNAEKAASLAGKTGLQKS